MKILFKGGIVVDPANELNTKADVLVEDRKIAQVGEITPAGDVKVIDATGKFVVPGLIDMHVHLREPGREDKETIQTGTQAAAAGGFTAVACMPNTTPVADNQTVIEFIVARAAKEGAVKVYPIGSITKGQKGEELSEYAELKKSGAVALSEDGKTVSNAELLRRAMEYANMFGMPIISHCEDINLVNSGVMNEGYISTILGLKGIPAVAEDVIVARDIILAGLTGAPLHIAHLSTAGAVNLIRMAKARSIRVTAEVTPHHFTLTDNDVIGYDTNTKVNPPLRTRDDLEVIRQALKDDLIDVIATDHAPHTIEDKEVEYNLAAFGMVGLETALGLALTELYHTGILTIEQLVKKMSHNPAKVLGVAGGTLSVGAAADITVIDPALEWVVDIDKFYSKGKNSPFNKRNLKGKAVLTMVNGKIVMQDGEVVA